ncbi:MAG: peptidylprolyl isomerase, partial [Byssovorax sp.]
SSIIGAAAVIAIAFVFIIQFRPASNAARVDSGPTCVAEINKATCISANDFWAAYRLLTYRGGDAARLKAMGMRRQTAEGLIEQWVLNQDAKRLGITVSDDDVSAEIAAGRAHVSLPVDKARQLAYSLGVTEDGVSPLAVKDRKTKKFDARTAEKDIRNRTRLSAAEFREYQKEELIAARMRDLVRERVHVGDNEAFEQFSREKSTASLDFVRFDRRFYADLLVDTSPAKIDDFETKNKADLDKMWESRKSQYLPECRVTRHVLVKVSETASDEDKAKARKKIERALERVNAGESFADVARAMSDDSSASRGGDLGCAQKGKMVRPFEDAMLGLEEGKVSGVVETQFGFHILKVEKIAKDAEAEKVGRRQTATELYISQEADRLANDAAQKVQAAVRGGKSLKDALDAHLAEIAPQIAERAPKAAKKDEKKGDKKDEKKDAAEDEDRAPVTAESHPQRPTVESTLPFTINGDPIQGLKQGVDIGQIAFGLQKPGDVANELVGLESGYAVVQLKEKAPASKEDWEKNREFYVGAMRAAKQADAVAAYVQRLRGLLASDVKLNAELTTEPKGEKNDQAPEDIPTDD